MKSYLNKELNRLTKAKAKLEKDLAKEEADKNELSAAVTNMTGDLESTREEADVEATSVEAEKVKGDELNADRSAKEEEYRRLRHDLD